MAEKRRFMKFFKLKGKSPISEISRSPWKSVCSGGRSKNLVGAAYLYLLLFSFLFLQNRGEARVMITRGGSDHPLPPTCFHCLWKSLCIFSKYVYFDILEFLDQSSRPLFVCLLITLISVRGHFLWNRYVPIPTISRRLHFFSNSFTLFFLTSAVPRAAVDVNKVGVRIARKCGLPQIYILFCLLSWHWEKNIF